MEHNTCDMKQVKMKGKIKTVCTGCAAEIKGFS
jgi:hypothetical protein